MTAAIGDRYRKAAELGPQRLFSLMRNRIIEPRWTGEGDAFTYVRQAEAGATETVLIDPEAGSRVIRPTPEPKPVPAGSRILPVRGHVPHRCDAPDRRRGRLPLPRLSGWLQVFQYVSPVQSTRDGD